MRDSRTDRGLLGTALNRPSPPSPPLPPLPPDRSQIETEKRNPRTSNLHQLDAAALVELIAEEDATLAAAMAAARPALSALIADAAPRFARGGRLIWLGAGTSGRLGALDAAEAPPTFCVDPGRVVALIAGGPPALTRAVEGAEDEARGAHAELDALGLTRDDTVVGITAGGTTPYVLGGLAHAAARTAPPLIGFIACAAVARPPGVDHVIIIPTGREVLTGSTRMKAGTATKLALNTISTALMILSGRVHENFMVEVRATNSKLRDRAIRIVAELAGLSREAAASALDRADGEVKTAIVMTRLAMELDAARELLARHQGRLHRCLSS